MSGTIPIGWLGRPDRRLRRASALICALIAIVIPLVATPGGAQDTQAPRFIFQDGQIIEVKPGDPLPGETPATLDPMAPIVPERVLAVGYLPIVPPAPLYVAVGEGLDRDIGYRLNVRRFLDAGALVRALTAHEIDAAYADIGRLIVARARGARIQVVAASAVGGVRVVARGRATPYIISFDNPAPGLRDFVRTENRQVRIASTSRDSSAFVGLKSWLDTIVELRPYEYRLRGMSLTRLWYYANDGPAHKPRVDLLVMPEPLVQALLDEEGQTGRTQIVMEASTFRPYQPISVLAVHSDLVEDDRLLGQDLVTIHLAALQMLISEPEAMVPYVRRYANFVPVSDERAVNLLDPAGINFRGDPRSIAGPALSIHNVLFADHVIEQKVNLHQLINTSYYDNVNPTE